MFLLVAAFVSQAVSVICGSSDFSRKRFKSFTWEIGKLGNVPGLSLVKTVSNSVLNFVSVIPCLEGPGAWGCEVKSYF